MGAVFAGAWLGRILWGWLLSREWAQARAGQVEVQRLSGFSLKGSKVVAQDVTLVCVTAELGFGWARRDDVEYVVKLRMQDGEYVRAVSGIVSAQEAGLIAGRIKGWLFPDRERG